MASQMKEPTVKQQVRDLLARLPDDCSLDDVQYELYLIDKVRRGERSLRDRGGIAHEEIRKRYARCHTA